MIATDGVFSMQGDRPTSSPSATSRRKVRRQGYGGMTLTQGVEEFLPPRLGRRGGDLSSSGAVHNRHGRTVVTQHEWEKKRAPPTFRSTCPAAINVPVKTIDESIFMRHPLSRPLNLFLSTRWHRQ